MGRRRIRQVRRLHKEEIPQNYTLAALYHEMRQGEDKVIANNTQRYEKDMARRRQEIEETRKNSETQILSEHTGMHTSISLAEEE